MKKGYFVFFAMLLFSILLLNLVSAQADYPGQEQLPINVTKIEETKRAIEEQKWDYLSNEWKRIADNNPIVVKIDETLSLPAVSVVFSVLFGQPYSLSLNLFWIIVLWFYLFFGIRSYLNFQKFFHSFVNWLIALGGVLLLAHLQLLKWFVELLGWLILSQTAWWAKLLIITGVLAAFIFEKYLRGFLKAAKEKVEKSSFRKKLKSLGKRQKKSEKRGQASSKNSENPIDEEKEIEKLAKKEFEGLGDTD